MREYPEPTMPMMACGHTANAMLQKPDGTQKPVCIICDCDVLASTKPDLTGRTAKCAYCGNTTPSKMSLPFFAYLPKEKYDSYYDGCFGWD